MGRDGCGDVEERLPNGYRPYNRGGGSTKLAVGLLRMSRTVNPLDLRKTKKRVRNSALRGAESIGNR